MIPSDSLIQLAETFLGVQDPALFLKDSDLPRGSAWCAAFVQYCIHQIERIYGIKSPVFDSDLVMKMWNSSPKELRTTEPAPGRIVVWEKGGTIEGHTGIVTKVIPGGKLYRTIEGNSLNPVNVMQRGVFEHIHTLSPVPKSRLQRLGFLNVFP